VCIFFLSADFHAGRKDVNAFLRAVAHCYAKIREMADDDDSSAETAEGESGEDDDARTQANRREVPVDASGPTTTLTPVTRRRLRDLPARRRAAANANTVLRS